MGFVLTAFLMVAGAVNAVLASVLIRSYLRERGILRTTPPAKLVFGAHRH